MARDPKPGQFSKPEPIPAIYRKGRFVASDPKAFDDMPPAFLRARKPQPEPTMSDSYSAARTATYLGIAALLIVIAVLVAMHNS
jgi:hypothetical protein